MQFTKEQLIEQAREDVDTWQAATEQFSPHPAQREYAAIRLCVAEIALAALTAKPLGWTDEQELRSVEKDGCGYLFKANPVSPNADPRRVIKLYRLPEIK